MKKILLIMLLALHRSVFAYTCDSIGWDGGDARINVAINPDVSAGKNLIVDLSQFITCKNDSYDASWVDNMLIEYNGLELNAAVFPGLKAGMSVSGTDYLAPVPQIPVLELGSQESQSVPVVIFFEMASLGQALHIHTGDYLGYIKFIQENNKDGKKHRYTWSFYASNDVDVDTSVCNLQSGDSLDVALGQIERGDMVSNGTSAQTVTKNVVISCDGTGPVNFEAKMSAVPASWDNNAIKTSNVNVGVETRWDGSIITNGNTRTFSVTNGSIMIPLSFTPVRPSTVTPDQVSTGTFSASATLIITQQ